MYNRHAGIDENYNFPPQVRQGIASSTEVRAMVTNTMSDSVDQLVADAISDDPTVRNAAAAAVEGVLGDRLEDIEDRLEPNYFLLNINHDTFTELELTRDYRVRGGILKGTSSGVSEKAIVTVSKDLTGDVRLTHDFRLSQDNLVDGRFPDSTLEEWSTRLGVKSSMLELTSVGDSMTMDYNSQGLSVSSELSRLLGVKANVRGWSGDTPTQIAWRIGALAVRMTVAGGVIPAEGQVVATMDVDTGWFRERSYDAYVVDINGVTRGIRLYQSGVENASMVNEWTVMSVDQAPIRVLDNSRIASTTSKDVAALSAPFATWIGRNDPDTGRVIRALSAIMETHRDPANRMLVRPIFNRSGDPSGSPSYDALMLTNQAISDIAGERFFDDRRQLIDNGLEIMKITPTGADLTAISEDRIPPSLLLDTLHLNVAGRKALAIIDAIELKARNWLLPTI